MKILVLALVSLMPWSAINAQKKLFGMADIHNHMLSIEGFGGNLFKGEVIDFSENDSDITVCNWVGREGEDPLSFLRSPYSFLANPWVRKVSFLRNCYNPEAFNKQQMNYKWLKRAYDGGLRLMVVQTVHNSLLCNLVRPKRGYSCDEKEAVTRQVEMLHKLERTIDRRSGGDGWFKIVDTPFKSSNGD